MIDLTAFKDDFINYLKKQPVDTDNGFTQYMEELEFKFPEYTWDQFIGACDLLLNNAYTGKVSHTHIGICGNLSVYFESYRFIGIFVKMVSFTNPNFTGCLAYVLGSKGGWDMNTAEGKERVEFLETMRDCAAHIVEHGTLGRDWYFHMADDHIKVCGHSTNNVGYVLYGVEYPTLRAARAAYDALQETHHDGM